MSITLVKATKSDIKEIWEMQVEAFKNLLEKYQDYDMSPATESYCKCQSKYAKKIQNKNVHFIHLLFGKNLLVYKNFQLF